MARNPTTALQLKHDSIHILWRQVQFHPISKAKRFRDRVPIRSRQFISYALRVDPFAVSVLRIVSDTEGPKMNVLNMSDVIAFVYVETGFAWISRDITHQLLVRTHPPNGLVWIQQATIQDTDVGGVF